MNSDLAIHTIRIRLTPYMTPNDKLYICEVGAEAVGVNLDCELKPLPNKHHPMGLTSIERPAFFMTGLLRSILRRRSKLLTTATGVAPIRAATAESSRLA
jgi:hypothetical protein